MPARNLLLVASLLSLPLLAQPSQTLPETAPKAAADTASPLPVSGRGAPGPQDSLPGPKSRADTVLVVKHRFDHREQIITGSVVMTCLTLMLVVMNNYNPR